MTEQFGPEQFAQRFNVSRETLDRLHTYIRILLDWNEKINLVGESTIPYLWTRHVLDSAQVLDYIPDWSDRKRQYADLGTGAGFPGMVLAIMGVGTVHLYEKSPRKCQFLLEVAEAVDADVLIHQGRSDEFPPETHDVILSRACAPLNKLLGMAKPFFGNHSIAVLHKGQNLDEELTQATKYWKMNTEIFPSCTDSRGRIIRIEALRHAGK